MKQTLLKKGFTQKVKRLKMEKKSQAHVEMILSFTIFVGVLLIVFIFLNPFSKTQEKKSYKLELVFKSFLNETVLNAGKISVIIDSDDDCYNRPSKLGEKFIEIQDSANLRKYTLYFSDYFGIGGVSCSSRIKRNYTLGVYSKESLIIYEKIADLKSRYESDYNLLKQNLGILNDFSWSFKDLNGNEISLLSVSKEIPSGINVQTKEISMIIMDKSGRFYEFIFNLKIW
ncbi:hypothetical protein J4429_05175 [Candidatus Pacearchaeota archaeon]|nr:hypothetical protein [Candidatus Pacearchaeota archaeon]